MFDFGFSVLKKDGANESLLDPNEQAAEDDQGFSCKGQDSKGTCNLKMAPKKDVFRLLGYNCVSI